ncbi:MAG: iron-sulfur cluster insertion protein ErpA [Telmatospirillum sp.]|nr:iron-sulfur cluster insertion protein ErpA [Telmatospirillum sp.]
MDVAGTTLDRQVALTENAARRVKKLRDMEGKPHLMLRLGVTGGGCQGFSYNFSLDDTVTAEDVTFDHFGVTLVVDAMALDLLSGATIDFVEDLVGSAFAVRNPNASSTCGCGTSFAV